MKQWKTIARQPVLKHSKWLTVENHTIELPDGMVLREWPWIITPDYVNVVSVTEEGNFLCFRQTKYGVEGVSLAPVGGYLELDEDPLAAAKRELLEETGCNASAWVSLGHYPVDGNHGAGVAHLYLARGVHQVAAPVKDDLEEQQLLSMQREEIVSALAAGEFKVLSWATAMALSLLHLQNELGQTP